MKKTAVEWLEKQYNQNGKLTPVDFYQAKAMEKEQIIDAYETSHISMMTSEQYFNETYNNKQ